MPQRGPLSRIKRRLWGRIGGTVDGYAAIEDHGLIGDLETSAFSHLTLISAAVSLDHLLDSRVAPTGPARA
jgi:hypothetical protein